MAGPHFDALLPFVRACGQVVDLRARLEQLGLPKSGLKAQLIERLQAAQGGGSAGRAAPADGASPRPMGRGLDDEDMPGGRGEAASVDKDATLRRFSSLASEGKGADVRKKSIVISSGGEAPRDLSVVERRMSGSGRDGSPSGQVRLRNPLRSFLGERRYHSSDSDGEPMRTRRTHQRPEGDFFGDGDGSVRGRNMASKQPGITLRATSRSNDQRKEVDGFLSSLKMAMRPENPENKEQAAINLHTKDRTVPNSRPKLVPQRTPNAATSAPVSSHPKERFSESWAGHRPPVFFSHGLNAVGTRSLPPSSSGPIRRALAPSSPSPREGEPVLIPGAVMRVNQDGDAIEEVDGVTCERMLRDQVLPPMPPMPPPEHRGESYGSDRLDMDAKDKEWFLQTNPTGLLLTLLGTGGSRASQHRAQPSVLLIRSKDVIVFDAGGCCGSLFVLHFLCVCETTSKMAGKLPRSLRKTQAPIPNASSAAWEAMRTRPRPIASLSPA